MNHLPGKFVWFEHVSNDIAKARAFYQPLLNWHIEAMPIGDQTYHMILSGAEGIGGFRTALPGVPSHWSSYLSVEDVDKSFAAATKAGAKTLMAPTDFAPVGRGATIADPTGAALSLWKSAQGDRADAEKTPLGDWFWNELWTPDAKGALAFYETVFGFSHETMDMGAQGSYYLLKGKDGKMRGGLMQSNPPKAAPMWLPYVQVADCDASAAKAKQLGARDIVVPPTDIANVGRFAVLIDPRGAALAIMRGAQAG
ncbi:MAG: VOC family protein [Burkholderiaceae bacterium]